MEAASQKVLVEGVQWLGHQAVLAHAPEDMTATVQSGIKLADLQTRAKFIRISPASVHESHAHGVLITREAPNYPGSV